MMVLVPSLVNSQNCKGEAARVITGQTYDVRSTQILGDLSWDTY